MERGVGAENKGRTLNEIDLELEMWSNEEGLEEDDSSKPDLNIQEQGDIDGTFLSKVSTCEIEIKSKKSDMSLYEMLPQINSIYF